MRQCSPPKHVTCHVSCVTSGVMCHLSHVTCHMSYFIYLFNFYLFFLEKVVKLIRGGSVINKAYPSSLLPTAVPVVCVSYCRPHGSEYHYDITVTDHTKCAIPPCHTFGLLSHHGRLGSGGLRQKKAARWHYRPPIKNITAYYKSQFCVSFYCCLLQEAQKRLWTCLNGAET